jgi:23S rRNA (adenine2503-C2)-methyltransferase
MKSLTDLKDYTLDQLTDWVESQGLPAFRAMQIFSWLYRPGINDFSQMTDIAKDVRRRLSEQSFFSRLHPFQVEESEDGTRKYAFRLQDGAVIESVMIPEPESGRQTLCISTQVGCAMGCGFCLTGTMGFKRNLTPAEIVNQVQAIVEMIQQGDDERSNNLVFMGMGEPLANFNNLIAALKILMEQKGLNFSSRRITVSTCGIVPKIKELGERITVNLAVSLHAADNETRSRIMPINNTYPLDALLAACREFPLPNRRKIMMEYILIDGLNDSAKDARALVRRLHGIKCKINLLPYNENLVFPYKTPPLAKVEAFQEILRGSGYSALIRTSRGSDISAACGQLAVEM